MEITLALINTCVRNEDSGALENSFYLIFVIVYSLSI